MAMIYIIKSSTDLDNKELFPVSGSSSQKVWISSDIDTEDKENIDTDGPESSDSYMSEILSFSVCKLRQKRQLHINTYFAVTGWMLCVITHICKDAKYHSYSDHGKQVNNVINTLFYGASEEEMAVTLDLFWTEYTASDNMIGSFDADEFIWKIKDIRDGNSHLCHQIYSLTFTKVIGFVACRVTSKVLGIGASDHSWGEVKTIISVKRSAISSDVL